MAETSIGLSEETKVKLDKLKVHPRETYEEVILRLIAQNQKVNKAFQNVNTSMGGYPKAPPSLFKTSTSATTPSSTIRSPSP